MQLKIDTMKQLNLLILGGIAVIISIVFGFMTIKVTGKYRFERSAYEMLERVNTRSQYLATTTAKDLTQNDTVTFIDIRTPKEFDGYHIENAQNIPFDRLLDDEHTEFLKNDQMKVLYGSTSVGSNAAWMILSQYGYDNLYVLDGGVQDWISEVETKDVFRDAPVTDETAKFKFSEVINPESN